MKVNLKLAGFVAGVLALPAVALAGGNWEQLPTVGVGPTPGGLTTGYTGQQGNVGGGFGPGTGGPINSTTVTAGPQALTGEELLPADTGLLNGAHPQTVTIPSSLLQFATNRLIGGDFDTNPNQRLSSTKGIASLAGISPTAAVMTADRWWTIAPAAGVTVTIDSTAATAVVPALQNKTALRLARTSSGAAGIMCVGQTLDRQAAAPLLGNNAVFSFWEENGAGQSATAGNFTVNIDYTSQADAAGTQATLGYAGANGSIFALYDTGGSSSGLANATHAIAGISPASYNNTTNGTVTSGVATLQGSTTWQRYAVYAPIPLLVPGTTTPVTEVSVSVCFTPTVTTAIATDYIELEGLQLEAKPSAVTTFLSAGVQSPTAFERRPAEVEAILAYYYWYFLYENQTQVSAVPNANCVTTTSTTAGMCNLMFPVPMRITPAVKYTAGFQAFTSTAYTAIGAMSANATYSNTLVTVPSNLGVMFSFTATTLPAVGTVNYMMQLGTSSATGIVVASAEP